MFQDWRRWASTRGYHMACGDPDLLSQIRSALEARRAGGEFDEAFYRDNLAGFRGLEDAGSPKPKTLLIFAVPRPAHRIVFESEDGPLEAVIPPTYHLYRPTSERIGEELRADLLGEEYRLSPLQAPLKPVAAALGLVSYGRNNITYAPGLGSYHQLVGFLTDAELGPRAEPAGPAALPECRRCRACRDACPTGAIGGDRFLLRAERCLTLFNENPGDWPDWLPETAHRCLVGCLACQQACPANEGKLRYVTLAPAFGADETACILDAGGQADPLWTGIIEKLSGLGLPGYETVIGRNLRALLDSGGAPVAGAARG